MLELIWDGECHNGHHAGQLSAWHWRFEARGDDSHYSYYFHVTLHAADAGEAVIDVAPDRDLLPGSLASFRRHRPESVWLSRGDAWERHPVAPDAPPDVVRVRVTLAAGETVRLSRMRPYPYSAVVARVEELAAHPEARSFSLGRSAEGREIAALEIGTGAERILVLAGQHPAEFGGTQAAIGIADWLLARLPDARAVRARYRVTVVPVLNPDGNVGGRCGHNARGEDLYRAFPGAAGGARPEAPEAACLWDHVHAHRPALTLNFHTFTQPSPAGDFPWEGLYTAPDEAFVTKAAREQQRRLDDRLAWETDGLSQHGGFARHVPASLEYQLATLGVPTVFYEVQDAVGPYRQRQTGVHVLRTALRAIEPAI
jgi:Zinc carboxypeptidase